MEQATTIDDQEDYYRSKSQSTSTAGEHTPLLTPRVEAHRSACASVPFYAHRSLNQIQGLGSEKVLLDEHKMLHLAERVQYPGAISVALMHVALLCGYIVYMLTAWLFCGAVRDRLFIKCVIIWPDTYVMQYICLICALLFWTFPLYCCFLLTAFYYRDLLRTELYFRLLTHNVFVAYEKIDFFRSYGVRSMLCYCLLACSYYLAGVIKMKDRASSTVPYWIPIVSFFSLLYFNWDIDGRLVSLCQFVEQGFDEAVTHIHESVFMRDYVVRQACVEVNEHLKEDRFHTTGEYIKGMVQKAEVLDFTGVLETEGVYERGIETMFTAMRQSLLPGGSGYWISDFLEYPEFDDPLSSRFRSVFRIYRYFTATLLCGLMYLYVATVVTHLHHQGWVETSWLTTLLSVEPLMIHTFD